MSKKNKLNDLVEDIHLSLIEEAAYRRYLEAIYDADACEGSVRADHQMAAIMIRSRALEIGSQVAIEKLETIITALHVVLRRAGMSVKARRDVAGEGFVMKDIGDVNRN